MHKDGRMVDRVNCKTPFLCFRADSGNFVESVSHTVIFLPSSRDLPVESQLELGETHSCMRRELYVVGSIKASGVPSYHQSWKPVSQQSSGVLPLKGGGPAVSSGTAHAGEGSPALLPRLEPRGSVAQ